MSCYKYGIISKQIFFLIGLTNKSNEKIMRLGLLYIYIYICIYIYIYIHIYIYIIL